MRKGGWKEIKKSEREGLRKVYFALSILLHRKRKVQLSLKSVKKKKKSEPKTNVIN